MTSLQGKKATIVLVEPDEMLASLIVEILGSAGYHVVLCGAGAEIVELLQRADADLLMVDVGRDRSLCQLVVKTMEHTQQLNDVPVIFCATVDPDLDSLSESPRSQRWALVRMPFDIDDLLTLTESLLNKEPAVVATATGSHQLGCPSGIAVRQDGRGDGADPGP